MHVERRIWNGGRHSQGVDLLGRLGSALGSLIILITNLGTHLAISITKVDSGQIKKEHQ